MKKEIIKLVLVCLGLLFCIVGCNMRSSMSYTFKVETGDIIKISLNSADGYSMTGTLPMSITKADEKVATGIFITLDTYEQYVDAIENNSKNLKLDVGSKNGMTYTFYCHNGEEYNYLIKFNGSKTGFILSSTISQEVAEECFERLTFSKK